MKCDCNYCVYWKKGFCIVDEVSMDTTGHCRECMYVSLDETYLEEKRKALLEAQAVCYANWKESNL